MRSVLTGSASRLSWRRAFRTSKRRTASLRVVSIFAAGQPSRDAACQSVCSGAMLWESPSGRPSPRSYWVTLARAGSTAARWSAGARPSSTMLSRRLRSERTSSTLRIVNPTAMLSRSVSVTFEPNWTVSIQKAAIRGTKKATRSSVTRANSVGSLPASLVSSATRRIPHSLRLTSGVIDGTRTRDLRSHSPAL